MATQIDLLLNIYAIERAGRYTTIYALRKLSKMSHGRCKRLLEDLEDKNLVYTGTRMYHGNIGTTEYNLTPYGSTVAHAIISAEAMRMPY